MSFNAARWRTWRRSRQGALAHDATWLALAPGDFTPQQLDALANATQAEAL